MNAQPNHPAPTAKTVTTQPPSQIPQFDTNNGFPQISGFPTAIELFLVLLIFREIGKQLSGSEGK